MGGYALTGFCDAECCFTASIVKNKESVLGFSIRLAFQVESHTRDLELLESIKLFFNTGKIMQMKNRNVIQYRVSSKEGLAVIIKHFYKYPLSTFKRHDFYLFTLLFNFVGGLRPRCTNKASRVSNYLYCLAIINNINRPIKPERLLHLLSKIEPDLSQDERKNFKSLPELI